MYFRFKRAAFSQARLRIVTLAWLTLLSGASLQPVRPDFLSAVHREIHWLAFAGAALLLFALSSSRRQEVLKALVIFLLGVSVEFLQHLIYRNPLEWCDIGDDGVAILLSFALYRLVARAMRRFSALPGT